MCHVATHRTLVWKMCLVQCGCPSICVVKLRLCGEATAPHAGLLRVRRLAISALGDCAYCMAHLHGAPGASEHGICHKLPAACAMWKEVITTRAGLLSPCKSHMGFVEARVPWCSPSRHSSFSRRLHVCLRWHLPRW